MVKMIVFDLDGTLCPFAGPAKQSTIDKLKLYMESGIKVVICSGKPTYYLCGLSRQMGLKDMIMAGENGAMIQYGVELPPKDVKLPIPENDKKELERIKSLYKEAFGEKYWTQPNLVMFTPFFANEEGRLELKAFFDKELDTVNTTLQRFDQRDCFDITPNINKADAVRYLQKEFDIEHEETVGVGDGVNDIPMFAAVGTSIGIGETLRDHAKISVPDIDGALDEIDRML